MDCVALKCFSPVASKLFEKVSHKCGSSPRCCPGSWICPWPPQVPGHPQCDYHGEQVIGLGFTPCGQAVTEGLARGWVIEAGAISWMALEALGWERGGSC